MHPQIVILVIHESIVMTLAILGNLFLLFVIIRGNRVCRRRISPVQLLLLHTCAADLLFAVCSLGLEIVTLITYPRFWGPEWVCKLMRYVQMFPMYASPFLLVAISADRFQAICRPLAHFRSSRYRRPNWLAMIAWSLALLLSIPQFFVWAIENDYGECATIFGRRKNIVKSIYVISFNTLAWLLPSIFAGSFYYCVCKAVWMSSTKPVIGSVCDSTKIQNRVNSDLTEGYIEELRKKSKGFRRQVTEFDRKRVQTVRLTLTIIACNFFLWAPFCVVNVITAVWPNYLSQTTVACFLILGNLNACVNPWIYILFNRSHVVKAICGKRKSGCTDVSQKGTGAMKNFDGISQHRNDSSSNFPFKFSSQTFQDNKNQRTVRRNVSFQTHAPKSQKNLLIKGQSIQRNGSDTNIMMLEQNKMRKNDTRSLTPTA